jgi:molybdate transport system substrate-binding protein
VRWWLAVALLALLLLACAGDDDADDLIVFAAASLRDVVGELEVAWLEGHPDRSLTIATEASNVLAAQIREGAPADVLLSADTRRPQELFDDGLTAAAPVPFVRNSVVLVAPRTGGAVQSAEDLAQPGVLLVGVSKGAPIARYADEAQARLAATMADPEAFATALADNIVSREDNVRAALAKVELGEGDAAFVYRTDLLGSDAVREVPLPAGSSVPAPYGAVQVSDRPVAAEFMAWLGEPAAAAVLGAAGFEVAP